MPAKLARARGAITLIVSLLCALLAITPARAQTFAGSIVSANGNNDTASATFSLVTGSTTYLQITLTNTSTFSKYNNADLLSGLFFSIATNPTVTTSTSSVTSPTALINSGKCASAACASPNVDLGYEWQFVYSQAGFTWPSGSQPPTTAASYGIASSQYSSLNPTFGKGVATPLGSGALDLAAKGTPQLAFSIVGSAYNASSSSISDKDPLIDSSITIDLTLPSGVSSLSISNVSFTYGTAPDGISAGTLVTTPEPSSLALFSAGLAIVGMVRNRKNRAVRVTSRIASTIPTL